MSDEAVSAVFCEDMEARVERENYDYEDSQDQPLTTTTRKLVQPNSKK